MNYQATIHVDKHQAQKIKDYMNNPQSEDKCLGLSETIINTATFDNGFQMDIKCCGCRFHDDGRDNSAWSEAVLYDEQGLYCSYTEPDDTYFQKWELEFDGDTYTVNIEIN